jgi:hypothetical protein
MQKTSTYYLFSFILCAVAISCNDNAAEKPLDEAGDTAKMEQVADIDILKDCSYQESFVGYLQGIPASTKGRGPYGIISCNDGPNAFDLIFSMRDSSAIDQLSPLFSKEAKTGYGSFNVFKFSIPSKTKEERKDEHEDPTIYPSVVKAYKREKGNWTYLGEKEVKDLGEYSTFIISNIKKEDK